MAIAGSILAGAKVHDERNPPETGITEAAMKQVKNGRLLLLPASEETRGHGTTGIAKFYSQNLATFLDSVPRRTAATTVEPASGGPVSGSSPSLSATSNVQGR